MSILGVPSPYINILVHLASNIIAPSLQEAVNYTISHPTFPVWLPPPWRAGLPGHGLPACRCGPNVILPSRCCASGFMTGACVIALGHSRDGSLPGNKKLLDATCLGQARVLLPRITYICFCLCSLIP